MLETAVACAEEVGPGPILGAARRQLGTVLRLLGRTAQAAAVLQRSLALADHPLDRAHTQLQISQLEAPNRASGGAVELAAEVVAAFRTHGWVWGTAAALVRMSLLQLARGDHGLALDALHEAHGLFARAGDETMAHSTHGAVGVILAERGDLEQARGWFVGQVESYRRLGYQGNIAVWLINLAACEQLLGNLEAAERAAREAETITTGLDDPLRLGTALTVLARIRLDQDRVEEAVRYVEQALGTLDRLGPHIQRVLAWCVQVEALYRAGWRAVARIPAGSELGRAIARAEAIRTTR